MNEQERSAALSAIWAQHQECRKAEAEIETSMSTEGLEVWAVGMKKLSALLAALPEKTAK